MTIRKLPNIIITGTPGVGKTTHCQQLAEATELSHLDINNVVKEKDCVDSYDEELHSTVVDEDKVHYIDHATSTAAINLCAAPRCYR